MSNVIPIRGEKPPQPPAGPAKRRPRPKKREMLELRESDDGEGFTTLDVVNGLRGVCQALDHAAVSNAEHLKGSDVVENLAQAANVLSDILANRVEV